MLGKIKLWVTDHRIETGLAIIVLITLLFAFSAYSEFKACKSLQENGVITKAKLISREYKSVAQADEPAEEFYLVTYVYEVNGNTYEKQIDNRNLFDSFVANQPISIVYDATNPENSTVDIASYKNSSGLRSREFSVLSPCIGDICSTAIVGVVFVGVVLYLFGRYAE